MRIYRFFIGKPCIQRSQHCLSLGFIMAKYKKGSTAKFAGSVGLNEDEEEETSDSEAQGLSLNQGVTRNSKMRLPAGGPFSALHPSICPQNARELALQDNADFRWDEFGFKVEAEDGPEHLSRKILSTPFVEDPQHRLRWIAHLEFTHNQVVEDLTWEKVDSVLPKSDKLHSMVLEGIPHSLRANIWPRLCGALLKKQQSQFTYEQLLEKAIADKSLSTTNVLKQIDKDLLRTMPSNVCFMHQHSKGVVKLRRILRSIAYLYTDIGYCQGTGVIVAVLLLYLEEEDVFWMMSSIIEHLLPASYFSENLLGLQADQAVLRHLVCSYLPEVDRVLRDNDIELSLISLHWFLTLFASVMHASISVRLWDLLFYEGTTALFKCTLAMLKLHSGSLCALSSAGHEQPSTTGAAGCSADLFNALSALPGSLDDADMLFAAADRVAVGLTEPIIQSLRKKQLAILMASQGLLISSQVPDDVNLPRQRVVKRKVTRSKSFGRGLGTPGWLQQSLSDLSVSGAVLDEDDPRLKNIRQTELMVDLREAILNIANHFSNVQPAIHSQMNLQPDFSANSHSLDHERFLNSRRTGYKRARALLDFERQDNDELGFRKNDIITIMSERDEHCWIGELNGLHGWFPAKFVQVLDERGKEYSAVGDDSVTQTVTDLVRGGLCSALIAVLQHGVKRSNLLGTVPVHPWLDWLSGFADLLFIERVAQSEVQKDYRSVESRLRLCRTFRLDEDGKVLTPEELLYRAVEQVNSSHDAVKVPLDVKLRSLVCIALNEQALHLWFEVFCCGEANEQLRRKCFHEWSFVRSPAWVQIKCELRVLSQFSFNLNFEWELPEGGSSNLKSRSLLSRKSSSSNRLLNKLRGNSKSADLSSAAQDAMQQPLKDGVRDMLVKHHLFSWDL